MVKANHTTSWRRLQFPIIATIVQTIFIVLFGVFVRYGTHADAAKHGDQAEINKTLASGGAYLVNNFENLYPMFQDIHAMIFVGFGFLMTFLKRYGFNAVGINMFIASLVIQWGMLIHGFFHMKDGKILIELSSLLSGDFATVSVLITMGAMLGKATPTQFLIIALIECPLALSNEYLGLEVFKIKDIGGSIVLHIFGAYFGIFCALTSYRKAYRKSENEGSVYHSDHFAMIGTIFLWLYWPSFNSAVASGDDRHRAVINTYLTLVTCTVTTFILSSVMSKERKFDMVHVQNSTLAGGVAVGAVADLMIQPYGAMLIGVISAIVSVFGYRFLSPLMSRIGLTDTCGVHNLHGMPGVISALASILFCGIASGDTYGSTLYQVFPTMAPDGVLTTVTNLDGITTVTGSGRTAGTQALYQLAALGSTLGIAIVSGALTGLLMRIPILDGYDDDELFSDAEHWEIPEENIVLEKNVYEVNEDKMGQVTNDL